MSKFLGHKLCLKQ